VTLHRSAGCPGPDAEVRPTGRRRGGPAAASQASRNRWPRWPRTASGSSPPDQGLRY